MVWIKKPDRKIRQIHDVLLSKGFNNAYILQLSKQANLYHLLLRLPVHKEQADLIPILSNVSEELNATHYKINEVSGKDISITFTTQNMTQVMFQNSMLNPNTLRITLPHHFGTTYLDFSDGASCHLLNGGTTRMGKTSLLIYLSTVLYLQTKGEIELHISSTKLKDFYMFQGVKNTWLSRTEQELSESLDSLLTEYKMRDARLYSKVCEKATDAKSVKKLYPSQYKHFKPIFLIIDEYARYADNKQIQKKVTELVESAGYVNIHIIIASQRPDARSVLPPRIKGNLLARICFTTADKNNSLIILDREGAENLGKIQGRALFLDSDLTEVQVPYLEPETAYILLNEYREEQRNENTNKSKEEKPRPTNTGLTKKIQDLIKKSNCMDDL